MKTAEESEACTRRLQALYNRPTCYEVVLAMDDGRRYLVGYVPGRSRTWLLKAAQRIGERIVALGVPESAPMNSPRAAEGFTIPGFGRIHFSGRTQRDCILTGELARVP